MTDKPSTGEPVVTLKPCPFCRHTEIHLMLGGGDRGYSMLCGGCGIRQGSAGRSQSEAIAAWNTRASHTGDDGLAAWERLKQLCCADPAKATRCVSVSKGDFLAALTPPSDQRGEG